jgi:membrane-bound lytic murein transglycosylase A
LGKALTRLMTGPLRAIILILIWALVGLGLAYIGLPKPKPEVGLRTQPLSFNDLPNWAGDDHAAALAVFKHACTRILKLNPTSKFGGADLYGTAAPWQAACTKAQGISPDQARAFFETEFTPYRLADGLAGDGLFTGYYESDVRGSKQRTGPYQTPIYTRPDDLIDIDLGEFAPDLKGRRTAGRIEQSRLKPYADRGAIMDGALGAMARPLVWLDDPIDAFFLEIQGSGRVTLPDGQVMRVTFSGQNGHAYTAIGQVMIKRGLMRREDVTMASLRAWLTAHPDERDTILRSNRSFVFFKESPIKPATDGPPDGPPGADGLSLTAGRSLAVDRSFHALGVPFYLDADDAAGIDPPLRRLMIAQDTGGAIRGIVRGDVFWGFGPNAANRAGRMKDRGGLYALLPNDLRVASDPKSK